MATTPAPAPAPKPKLLWYQHLWTGWPIVLVFVGGAIGGLCGGLAWGINQQVFQKTQNPVLRYVWTGLISVAAVVTYFILAIFVLKLIGK
jgi:hypothetical protein